MKQQATRDHQPATSDSTFPCVGFSSLRPQVSGLRFPPCDSPRPAPCSLLHKRKRSAFTLIELLVVIAIIAILASLAFPAVQGALDSGKKAQARNDVAQLVAAVKAFQLEYGRLPSTSSGSDLASAPNAAVIKALIAKDTALNPRNITFFEGKEAKGNPPKGGRGSDDTYYDPWGNPYTIMLDTSYDNRITAYGATNLTTVIVSSPGGTDLSATNKIITNVK